MRYSASLIVDAERPGVITLGRFTWRARPVSAPVMLRFHAARASGDVVRMIAALMDVLRAAYPSRWWYRLRRRADPVWHIMRLPDDIRDKAIASLFRVPGQRVTGDEAIDPIERMRREQRAAVYGKESNEAAPTLALAVMRCRVALGETWFYDPKRYDTTDGYVPFRDVWVCYMGLDALAARDRLETVAATSVLHQKDAKRVLDKWFREAHPTDALVS